MLRAYIIILLKKKKQKSGSLYILNEPIAHLQIQHNSHRKKGNNFFSLPVNHLVGNSSQLIRMYGLTSLNNALRSEHIFIDLRFLAESEFILNEDLCLRMLFSKVHFFYSLLRWSFIFLQPRQVYLS